MKKESGAQLHLPEISLQHRVVIGQGWGDEAEPGAAYLRQGLEV
jgi:hypothetical protein